MTYFAMTDGQERNMKSEINRVLVINPWNFKNVLRKFEK